MGRRGDRGMEVGEEGDTYCYISSVCYRLLGSV